MNRANEMIYVVLVRSWGEDMGYPMCAYKNRSEADACAALRPRREVAPIPVIETNAD